MEYYLCSLEADEKSISKCHAKKNNRYTVSDITAYFLERLQWLNLNV